MEKLGAAILTIFVVFTSTIQAAEKNSEKYAHLGHGLGLYYGYDGPHGAVTPHRAPPPHHASLSFAKAADEPLAVSHGLPPKPHHVLHHPPPPTPDYHRQHPQPVLATPLPHLNLRPTPPLHPSYGYQQQQPHLVYPNVYHQQPHPAFQQIEAPHSPYDVYAAIYG